MFATRTTDARSTDTQTPDQRPSTDADARSPDTATPTPRRADAPTTGSSHTDADAAAPAHGRVQRTFSDDDGWTPYPFREKHRLANR